jgi:hypothetical protein
MLLDILYYICFFLLIVNYFIFKLVSDK